MTLDDWLAFAPQLDAVYQQELSRSCYSDPQAFVNWAYHFREDGRSLDWIRDRIRESAEWREKHASNGPPIAPTAAPRLIKLTGAEHGTIANRGYSYWPASYIDGGSAYSFCGTTDGQPLLFLTYLPSGSTNESGWLQGFPRGTTEGWYWTRDGYICYVSGAALMRRSLYGDTAMLGNLDMPGCDLWQCHSSDDGTVHCGTVRRIVDSGAYPKIGTIIFTSGGQRFVEAKKDLDESHVTGDGTRVIIEEGGDNRIVDVATGMERWIRDADGALSHIDTGPSYMVGEDDQHGKCVRWDFRPIDPTQWRALFDTWGMGHVSVQAGKCLLSDATKLAWVDLMNGGVTPIVEHGSEGDQKDYDYQVRANLDATARVATFVAFKNGRHDLYLLVL